MRILFGILLIIAIIINCEVRAQTEKQVLNFGSFTIETPNYWIKIKSRGIDSYVGGIAIGNGDTLNFDLGFYSNSLTESIPRIFERSQIKQLVGVVDTTGFIFVDNRKDINPEQFKINIISWDTIDKYRAKIVSPKNAGIGTTGVYIDSLWNRGMGNVRFNLYGKNLKPENERLVIQAIRTLRFYKAE